MGECPVCSLRLESAAALEAHVNSHFDDDARPAQPTAAAAGAQQQPSAATCPQCGRRVAAAELASHQLAHQLEEEERQLAAAAAAAEAGTLDADRAAAEALAASERAAAVAADEQAAAELAAAEWGDASAPGSGAGSGDEQDDAAHRAQLEELYFQELRARYGFTQQPRPGCCRLCGEEGHWVRDCLRCPERQEAARRVIDPRPALIASTQQRASPTALPGGAGLVQLLAACLEQQQLPSSAEYRAALCGEVQHFGATLFSAGWGCGYNNVQMLASHLLATRPEAREALFGGAGWVPDIPALQAWLEAAWAAGFDRQGAEQLEGRVQGTQKWVGTTECAALLRSFGLRAQIVDFGVQQGQPAGGAVAAAPAAATASGSAAMPVHPSVQCDGCGQLPIRGDRWKSQSRPDYDLCSTCHASSAAAAAGPFLRMLPLAVVMAASGGGGGTANAASSAGGSARVQEQLLQWVWRYFTSDDAADQPSSNLNGGGCRAAGPAGGTVAGGAAAGIGGTAEPGAKRPRLAAGTWRVRLSGKPPLYFQHEGHSRTIIGIERRLAGREQRAEHCLLVLDSNTPGAKLAAALQQRQGWQRLLKRGPHTLRQQQYQLLFVQPGLAAGAELEALKRVAACQRY